MFRRIVEPGLELELLQVEVARELFLAVDDSRAHLRRWLSWVDDTRQILDTREFLRLSMAGWAEGRMVRCGIRLNGRLCGSVSIEGIDATNGHGEIGYWLSHDCEGQGVMTRSVAALSKMAFDEVGLHRLELHAAEANTRSWAIPERLGWSYEGTKRQALFVDGERSDIRLYSLLKTDSPVS